MGGDWMVSVMTVYCSTDECHQIMGGNQEPRHGYSTHRMECGYCGQKVDIDVVE